MLRGASPDLNAMDHNSALRPGRESSEADAQVLRWQFIGHSLREKAHYCFDDDHGGRFPRASVIIEVRSATLGDHMVRVHTALTEAFGSEYLRMIPDGRVVVGSEKVQYCERPPNDSVSVPFEIPCCPSGDDGEERKEPAGFLREVLENTLIAALEPVRQIGSAAKSQDREQHEAGDRYKWPEHINQFDSGDIDGKSNARFVPRQ